MGEGESQVPDMISEMVEGVFEGLALALWWNSPSSHLNCKSPKEVWRTDPERLMAYVRAGLPVDMA